MFSLFPVLIALVLIVAHVAVLAVPRVRGHGLENRVHAVRVVALLTHVARHQTLVVMLAEAVLG